jgi:hypothetical protein
VNWAVGNTFDATALLVEAASTVGAYFDGTTAASLPAGWSSSWFGVANASISNAYIASIAVSPETSTNPRVGVTLDGWASPRNGSLQVYRVHPDTTEYPVRGSGPAGTWATSNGVAFAWDYEMPLGVAVTYYAMDGATRVDSPSTSLNIAKAWLKVPGNPGSDLQVDVEGKPEQARRRPAMILEPLGRENPVVVVDSRKGSRFKMRLRTKTDAAATALVAALKTNSVNLLEMPGVRDNWRYIAILDIVEHPFVDYRAPAGAPTNHVAYWSDWELDCIVVDRPTGGIVGDPTASYAALVSTYATYSALRSAKSSYLDVLRGV